MYSTYDSGFGWSVGNSNGNNMELEGSIPLFPPKNQSARQPEKRTGSTIEAGFRVEPLTTTGIQLGGT